MPTITIPKKIIYEGDYVKVPRKSYEELLRLKKIIPIYKPTQSELRALKRGRKDFKEGRYVSWRKLKRELANLRNRTGKKEN